MLKACACISVVKAVLLVMPMSCCCRVCSLQALLADVGELFVSDDIARWRWCGLTRNRLCVTCLQLLVLLRPVGLACGCG